jgi:hypothetical protein
MPSLFLPGLTWHAVKDSWTQADGYDWSAQWNQNVYTTRESLAHAIEDWNAPHHVALRIEAWIAFVFGPDAFFIVQNPEHLDASLYPDLKDRWKHPPKVDPLLGDMALLLHSETQNLMLCLPSGLPEKATTLLGKSIPPHIAILVPLCEGAPQ